MQEQNEPAPQIGTGEELAEEKGTAGRMPAAACTNQSASLSQSTGPRTPEGKEKSKRNAIKHGIFSKVVALKGEPRVAFNALVNGLFSDLQPQTVLEGILVEKLAILIWRYRRLIVAEAEHSKSVDLSNLGGTLWTTDYLLRYDTIMESDFDRTLSQLERLQRMRLGQPIPPPIKLDISSDRASE